MTAPPPKGVVAPFVMPRPKTVFETINEALYAMGHDPLATVYHKGSKVFVVTAHGSGEFDRKAWLREKAEREKEER